VPRDTEGGITAYLLLIDDDPALIPKLVSQVFPGPAHRVEATGTGAEGLERVSAVPPDVVLFDLRVPGQSGLGFCRSERYARRSDRPELLRADRPRRDRPQSV
jgi:CheY-like chemotaxis protein